MRFRFVGDGVFKPELERRARASGLSAMSFEPSQPPERLVDIIRDADLCVATTRAHELCGETIPVKLFDYLACGRPVVAAVSGDAAEVVQGSGGGVVTAPGDGAALAAGHHQSWPAIRSGVRRWGARAPSTSSGTTPRRVGETLVRVLEETHRRARGRPIEHRPGGLYGALRRAADRRDGLRAPDRSCRRCSLLIALLIRLDSRGPRCSASGGSGAAPRVHDPQVPDDAGGHSRSRLPSDGAGLEPGDARRPVPAPHAASTSCRSCGTS